MKDGQGFFITNLPAHSPCSSTPFSSTTAISTPKDGTVAEPGLVAIAPGKGLSKWAPVSVCQYVSTIAHRPSPTTLWYHLQASGLIGSQPCQESLGWHGSDV